jgi:hypothetical protein
MPSSKKEKLPLADAITQAISPLSSSTAAASGSQPSNATPPLADLLEEAKQRYLIIGARPYLVPHNPEIKTEHDHVAVEVRNGFLRIRRGQWTPPCPALDHLDPHERIRRQRLWYRSRVWTGRSGLEVLAQLLNNDMANCVVEEDDDKAPAMPPEVHADNALYPLGDDRISESKRQHFAPLAQSLGVDISAFFRADNDLGFGNDTKAASQELTNQLEALRKAQPAPTPLPEIPESKLLSAASNLAKGVPSSGSSSPPPATKQKSIVR